MGTKNSGSLWTKGDVKQLRSMWKKKLPLKKIAKALKRTEMAVMKKATVLGIRKPAYYRPFVLPNRKPMIDPKSALGRAGAEDQETGVYLSDGVTIVDVLQAEPTGEEFPQSVNDDTLTGGQAAA